MKKQASKLDDFVDKLDQWFGVEKITFADAACRLRELGCDISIAGLSKWWGKRETELMQAQMLARITSGAQKCREIESEFSKNPAPEVKTLISLLQVVILHLSTTGKDDPKTLVMIEKMLKPVLKFYDMTDKHSMVSLAEQKYRDQVAEKKAAIERELNQSRSTGGISAETLEKIQKELKLL